MPAIAEGRVRWRMATSWTKNLPGPGTAAAHFARRIGELTGGRLEVDLFGAGEIVPGLQVLDAVSNGSVEMGHTAAFYWVGKMPASVFFTTVPFGAGPVEHQSWLERGGGQALWEELYAPFGVRPMLAGNTGPSMGGWFRKPIAGLADAMGLRIRVQGLGAEVWQQLGATGIAIPVPDMLPALSKGVVDGVEFLAPMNDAPMGFASVAANYYAPGFNKPNGAAEALINTKAWEKLTTDQKAAIAVAAAETHARGLAEAEALNGAALVDLIQSHNVQVTRFSPDLLAAARKAAELVVGNLAGKSELSGRIHNSYTAFRSRTRLWRRIGVAGLSAMNED
ncbi:MAG: TRAP transporter substrate-binding protein [Proteobacteria bacterium]|nr:TRAP transporter substrate-binding protein [Pseudomonadota bacterium]